MVAKKPILCFACCAGMIGVANCGTAPSDPQGGTPAPPTIHAAVSGAWTLSGRGERSGCSNAIYEGSFSLTSGVPLLVTQTPQAIGKDLLSLATPLQPRNGGTFSFSGNVSGSRVSFATVEAAADYHLVFNFVGTAVGRVISGTVTGTGPEDCLVSGSFEVTIQGDNSTDGQQGPGDPGPGDPGPGDADAPGDVGNGDGDFSSGDGMGGDGDTTGNEIGCGCGRNSNASNLAAGGMVWVCAHRRKRRRRRPSH